MYKRKLFVTNKKGGQGVRITYTKTQTEYTGELFKCITPFAIVK